MSSLPDWARALGPTLFACRIRTTPSDFVVVEQMDLEFSDDGHLASVDVSGVRRKVNVDLMRDEDLREGDWVLIHVGFAMAKIDEREAAQAMQGLRLMGSAFDEELDQLLESDIE